MSDYLPPDVLIGILSKLPPVSLVRLRCVSKSWDFLITSPLLADEHLKYSRKNNQLVLLRTYPLKTKKENYSLRFDDSELTFHSEFELPVKSEGKCFGVVGSVNGVICLVDNWIHFTSAVVFWNPSCGKYVKLPQPTISCYMCARNYLAVVGFGYDFARDDYKVIRIVFVRRVHYSYPNLRSAIAVELYSHSERSWKRIDASLEPFAMNFHGQKQAFVKHAFLKGVVYWLAIRVVNEWEQYFGLLFDMGTEKFDEFMLPECLAFVKGIHVEDTTVSAFEEKLALFVSGNAHFDVWVMEKHGLMESWTKMYSVRKQGILERPLAFRQNGEILMETFCGNVVAIDPVSEEIHRIREFVARGFSCAESYLESLVLLHEANGESSFKSVNKKRKEMLPDIVQGMKPEDKAAGTSRKEEEDNRDKVVKTDITKDNGRRIDELVNTIEGFSGEVKSLKAHVDGLNQAVCSLQEKIINFVGMRSP